MPNSERHDFEHIQFVSIASVCASCKAALNVRHGDRGLWAKEDRDINEYG